MTDTYKAIVYVRRIFCDIKCPEDQDLSTAEQLDIIRQYLLQKPDVEYSAVLSDGHKQKQDTALKGFQRLIPLLKKQGFNCLVLSSVELFAPTADENKHCLLSLIPELGIRIISVREDYDSLENNDSATGYPILTDLVKQAEIKEQSRRSKMNHMTNKVACRNTKTSCPYGYLPGAQGTLELYPDPETYFVVQAIFRDYLSGKSVNDISRALTATHVPSPSQRKEQLGFHYKRTVAANYWHPTTVKGILVNMCYTGDLVFSNYRETMFLNEKDSAMWANAAKPILENNHPALVSKDDFERAQIMLQAEFDSFPLRKRNGRRLPGNPYRNMIRCSVCGAVMLYEQRNSNGRNPHSVYVCANGRKRGGLYCSLHITEFAHVDSEIRTALEYEIDLANKASDRLLHQDDNAPFKQVEAGYQGEMNVYLNAVRKLSLQLSQLNTEYMAGSIQTEEYYHRKQQLTEETEKNSESLNAAMEQLRTYRSFFTIDNPWLRLYSDRHLPKEMPFDLAKELIDTVTVSPEEEVFVTCKHGEFKQQLLSGLMPERK